MARVLIVDDDPDIRALLEARLKRAGHRVVGAGSGEDALALIADKGPPEVAVLDVLMPGISGLDLLARLRDDAACSEMPAIFLSGRVEPADIAAGGALGATYLTKPVVFSALTAAIDRSLLEVSSAAGSW